MATLLTGREDSVSGFSFMEVSQQRQRPLNETSNPSEEPKERWKETKGPEAKPFHGRKWQVDRLNDLRRAWLACREGFPLCRGRPHVCIVVVVGYDYIPCAIRAVSQSCFCLNVSGFGSPDCSSCPVKEDTAVNCCCCCSSTSSVVR